MKNKREGPASDGTTAQPRFHQRAAEIQAYGTVNHLLSLELEETVRLEMTAQLNQHLADTMTLRDLYKKSHWQVADVLPVAFAFRQALRRASGTGRLHRRADTTPRRHQHRDGARCC